MVSRTGLGVDTVLRTVAAGKGDEGRRQPRAALCGAAFEGRKFVILAFALQCVSVSLDLFLIHSMDWRCVLPVGGAESRTFASGGKNPRAATAAAATSDNTRLVCGRSESQRRLSVSNSAALVPGGCRSRIDAAEFTASISTNDDSVLRNNPIVNLLLNPTI